MTDPGKELFESHFAGFIPLARNHGLHRLTDELVEAYRGLQDLTIEEENDEARAEVSKAKQVTLLNKKKPKGVPSNAKAKLQKRQRAAFLAAVKYTGAEPRNLNDGLTTSFSTIKERSDFDDLVKLYGKAQRKHSTRLPARKPL